MWRSYTAQLLDPEIEDMHHGFGKGDPGGGEAYLN